MRVFRTMLLCAAALGAVALWTIEAFAEEVVYEEKTVYAGPNREMLWSGIVSFGVPYVIGDVVASQSHHVGDDKLYIPVAGPWLDLAERGGCPVAASSCTPETVNKALLIGDGILQGVGTLSILSAFFHPEREVVRERRVSEKTPLHLAPLTSPSVAGATVLGTF